MTSEPKFKLFDEVLIDGTATGYGVLTGMIWEEPKVVGDEYYYTVRANTLFFVAEHHLTAIT